MIVQKQIKEVAFIGLGKMGAPMAANIASAGFKVHGYDRSASAREAMESSGLRLHSNAGDAADAADMIITMLPDGRAVRNFLLGEAAKDGRIVKGTIVVDMSSSEPLGTKSLGESLSSQGIFLIDAPVSGGVARARNGTLTIMAGGDPQLIENVLPVLETMGSNVVRTGSLGSGHAAKALNNYVSAAGLSAACEALLTANAFGLDEEVLVDVLNMSTGRNNSTEVKLKPHILSGKFASGFSLALMAKDLRTAAELSGSLGDGLAGMEREADLWEAALDALGVEADHTEIYRFLKRRSRLRDQIQTQD